MRRQAMRHLVAACALLSPLVVISPASADEPPAAISPPGPTPSASGPTAIVKADPTWWRPRALETGQHFTIDPVTDGVLIGGGAAISGLLGFILSTGEIKAALPGPTSNLLPIDRPTVTQHIDPNAGAYSNLTLYAALDRSTTRIALQPPGAMVGVLVPHVHRHAQEAPPIWIGFVPEPGGGAATVGARF